LPVEDGLVRWYAAASRERALQEESAQLQPGYRLEVADVPKALGVLQVAAPRWSPMELCARLQESLAKSGVTLEAPTRWLSLSKGEQPLETVVRYECGGRICVVEASVVVVAHDSPPPGLLTWLDDKIVPVTLSSFLFREGRLPVGDLAWFNGGADFALQE